MNFEEELENLPEDEFEAAVERVAKRDPNADKNKIRMLLLKIMSIDMTSNPIMIEID